MSAALPLAVVAVLLPSQILAQGEPTLKVGAAMRDVAPSCDMFPIH